MYDYCNAIYDHLEIIKSLKYAPLPNLFSHALLNIPKYSHSLGIVCRHHWKMVMGMWETSVNKIVFPFVIYFLKNVLKLMYLKTTKAKLVSNGSSV